MERIYEKARQIAKAVSYTALTLSLAATMNHARTRYEITESINPDGSVSYEHEDERTTKIMRFLTGTGELPVEDRLLFYRQAVRAELGSGTKENPQSIPEDFDSLDEAGLRALLLAHVMEKGSSAADANDRVEKIFEEAIESPLSNDSHIAGLMWELQQRVGAPRLRWAAEDEDGVASFMKQNIGDGRAFYNAITNTIYLSPSTHSPEALASEDAHALQFHERPILSYAHSIIDAAGSVVRTVTRGGDFSSNYQANYDRPGSFEHEAHSVIGPEFMQDFVREAEVIEKEQNKQP